MWNVDDNTLTSSIGAFNYGKVIEAVDLSFTVRVENDYVVSNW